MKKLFFCCVNQYCILYKVLSSARGIVFQKSFFFDVVPNCCLILYVDWTESFIWILQSTLFAVDMANSNAFVPTWKLLYNIKQLMHPNYIIILNNWCTQKKNLTTILLSYWSTRKHFWCRHWTCHFANWYWVKEGETYCKSCKSMCSAHLHSYTNCDLKDVSVGPNLLNYMIVALLVHIQNTTWCW